MKTPLTLLTAVISLIGNSQVSHPLLSVGLQPDTLQGYIQPYILRNASETAFASFLDTTQLNESQLLLVYAYRDRTPETLLVEETKTIAHDGYVSVMHTRYHIPVSVSHTINRESLSNADNTSGINTSAYPSDPAYPLLKATQYSGSGYDHGHLAPKADFKHSREQYKACFQMTNIAPQHGCMNQKGWCHLEELTRHWAKKHSNYDFYIVSGPVLKANGSPSVFIDSLCIRQDLKVYVPRYYYKVILAYDQANGKARAIGFVVPNKNVENVEIQEMYMSVDAVEQITGLNFFAELPDDIEEYAEALIWDVDYPSNLSCPSKACTSVYSSNRPLPENRTKYWCR